MAESWLKQARAKLRLVEHELAEHVLDVDRLVASVGVPRPHPSLRPLSRELRSRFPELWNKCIVQHKLGAESLCIIRRFVAIVVVMQLKQLMARLQLVFEANLETARRLTAERTAEIRARAPKSHIGTVQHASVCVRTHALGVSIADALGCVCVWQWCLRTSITSTCSCRPSTTSTRRSSRRSGYESIARTTTDGCSD